MSWKAPSKHCCIHQLTTSQLPSSKSLGRLMNKTIASLLNVNIATSLYLKRSLTQMRGRHKLYSTKKKCSSKAPQVSCFKKWYLLELLHGWKYTRPTHFAANCNVYVPSQKSTWVHDVLKLVMHEWWALSSTWSLAP